MWFLIIVNAWCQKTSGIIFYVLKESSEELESPSSTKIFLHVYTGKEEVKNNRMLQANTCMVLLSKIPKTAKCQKLL